MRKPGIRAGSTASTGRAPRVNATSLATLKGDIHLRSTVFRESTEVKMQRLMKPIAKSVLCVALVAAPALAMAQAQAGAMTEATHVSPLGDLSEYRTIAEDALKLTKAGDFAGAHKRLEEFESTWDNHEDTNKKKSYNTWKGIDNQLDFTLSKLGAKKPDAAASEKAVQNLIARLR